MDYAEYSKLSQQYADGIQNEVQPFFSRSFLDSGQGYQVFYVNTATDGETIFGRQNPAQEAGNVSIELVMNAATAVAVQCTVVALYQEEIMINPSVGSVRCSWA